MSIAIRSRSNEGRFAHIPKFELDDSGMPIMPTELAPFFGLRFGRKSNRAAEDLADNLAAQVYKLWAENGFRQVPRNPGPEMGVPPCYDQSGGKGRLFDCDDPDPADYEAGVEDPNFLFDQIISNVEMAAGKRLCSGCPIQLSCLANSLTVELPPREDEHGDRIDRVGFEKYQLFGGYGPSAREYIFRKVVALWCDDVDPAATKGSTS